MKIEWKQVLAALAIGCVLGAGLALGKLRWLSRHGTSTDRMLSKLTRELRLDGKQQDAVRAILELHRARTKALRQETRAQFDQIRAAMHKDMAKLLDPEQQTKLEALKARADARRKKWEPGL